MLVSIIIRTLNEAKYLGELLSGISSQRLLPGWEVEIVVVDSGSTDQTLEIAASNDCRITHISASAFSFGRSLNQGCEFSQGDYLVFVSGHCVPAGDAWLVNLVEPLVLGQCDYCYGRQIGCEPTRYSEEQLFSKMYPAQSALPQQGYFANNANAALPRPVWEQFRFDEELTGLEDMHLAKRLVDTGGTVGYTAAACVRHIHHESWVQVKTRYRREGQALLDIIPGRGLSFIECVSCTISGIWLDAKAARKDKRMLKYMASICAYRLLQYWGSFQGMRQTQRRFAKLRRSYFHPKATVRLEP